MLDDWFDDEDEFGFLYDKISELENEVERLNEKLREFGLRDPDYYSLAEMTEIRAAVERIMSPLVLP